MRIIFSDWRLQTQLVSKVLKLHAHSFGDISWQRMAFNWHGMSMLKWHHMQNICVCVCGLVFYLLGSSYLKSLAHDFRKVCFCLLSLLATLAWVHNCSAHVWTTDKTRIKCWTKKNENKLPKPQNHTHNSKVITIFQIFSNKIWEKKYPSIFEKSTLLKKTKLNHLIR